MKRRDRKGRRENQKRKDEIGRGKERGWRKHEIGKAREKDRRKKMRTEKEESK